MNDYSNMSAESYKEKRKILLIDPRGWGRGINIGLGYIVGLLSANGHEVKVIDLNNYRSNQKKRLVKGVEWKPDYIGVSAYTSYNIKEAMATIALCKNMMGYGDRCTYIIGGPGATSAGADLFEKYHGLFDILVKGEGEYTFLEIVEGGNLSEIDGIIYNKSQKIVENKDRDLICNLDTLPFPKYEAFDQLPTFDLGVYDTITSRGCPFNCVFCLNKLLTRRKFRARSPENVVDEIERAKEIFRIKEFRIQDDNFTLDIKRAQRICDLIIERELNIEFHLDNGVRADRISPELTRKLKAAGCSSAIIGIENGDEETFSFVRKGETLDDIKKAVCLLKDNNIKVKGTTIIGLINSTFNSDMRSVQFVKSLGIDSIWHHAFPYRGTELYEWVKKNGKFLHDSFDSFDIDIPYETYGLHPIAFETPEYTAKERNKAYIIACMETHQYVRPVGWLKIGNIKRFLGIVRIIWDHDKSLLPKFAYAVVNFFLLSPLLHKTVAFLKR